MLQVCVDNNRRTVVCLCTPSMGRFAFLSSCVCSEGAAVVLGCLLAAWSRHFCPVLPGSTRSRGSPGIYQKCCYHLLCIIAILFAISILILNTSASEVPVKVGFGLTGLCHILMKTVTVFFCYISWKLLLLPFSQSLGEVFVLRSALLMVALSLTLILSPLRKHDAELPRL